MTDSAAHLSPSIHTKLRSLRRSLRLWHVADGLRRWLTWLLLFAALDLALDWVIRMDLAQRAICGVLILAGLAVVIYRRLVRPLVTPVADDALILRVEQRHRQIEQRLISAVQFARGRRSEHTQPVSHALIDATIEQGGRAAQAVDFGDVVNTGGLARNLAVLALLLAMVAGVGAAVAYTEPLGIWFDRNVLLGDRSWPQDTQFVIEGARDGKMTLPRGDDHDQAVRAEGVVPELVKLDYAPHRGSSVTMAMVQRGEHRFHATFKNMLEPFRFRVRGGDAVSPWIDVELVDRPAVHEFRLEVTPPAYVGSGPEVVWAFQTQQFGPAAPTPLGGDSASAAPRGTSAVYALKGSRLQIAARSNKPLSQVAFRVGERTLLATIDAADPAQFTAAVAPEQLAAGTYEIELADTSGPPALASRQPTRFTVRIRPDRVPTIQAKLLGISGMVLSRVVIPIEMTVQDDFAVTQVRLSGDWRVQEETQQRSDRIGATLAVGQDRLGREKLQYVHRFDLEPLKLSVGADVTFRIEADDNDTVSGPKTGKSSIFYVKVVQEQDLRTELLRREQEQRQEFERLLHIHEELLAQTRGLGSESAAAAQLTDDQRKLLADVQKRQHLVGTRCEAIARQFAAIEAEVANNRLEEPDGPIQRRVQTKIIEPLDALAARKVPVVSAELENARRPTADKAARSKAFDAAVAAQQDVTQTMREILKHMVKWEGYQEAVNLALEVLKAQEDVNEATKKAIRKRLEGIFGPEDTKPSPAKPPAPKP